MRKRLVIAVLAVAAGSLLGVQKARAAAQTSDNVVFQCLGDGSSFTVFRYSKSASAPAASSTDCAQQTADLLNAGFSSPSDLPGYPGSLGGGFIRTMVRIPIPGGPPGSGNPNKP